MPLSARFMTFAAVCLFVGVADAQVPGYVPPVSLTQAPDYADDTRGVFVPGHMQYRLQTEGEMRRFAQQRMDQAVGPEDEFEREMNRIAAGDSGWGAPVTGDGLPRDRAQPLVPAQPASGGVGYAPVPQQPMGYAAPQQQPYHLAPAPHGLTPVPSPQAHAQGVELARTQNPVHTLDVQNTIVRLREDRVSIRRVMQRMLDQAGASDWTLMWDLNEQNRALPDMEISIDAHEPFVNVMNALLARMQTRSGTPLRVVRYDNNRRIVVTDRPGSATNAETTTAGVGPVGVGGNEPVVVTERVMRESLVSLHYDEIPLVDALESLVNQAGKGQWRLRIYAGVDQVLKPAHIEEPFAIAMERLLRLFNLKYEVFPGGKLVVVTHDNRFGFTTGMQN